MTKKLSFVVPVYNVEAYLEECVRSIARQMTDECEIVLVDDGSTDGSGALCDRLAQDCDGIVVIHRQNGGLSEARNTGLKRASGEYVAFVDSDDYIADGSVAALLEYARQGCDVCFLRACKLYPDGSTQDLGDGICRESVFQKSKDEVLEYLSSRPKYPGSACTKVFRRSFLEALGLRFIPHVRCEDLFFCMQALLAAETFDALDVPYYFYRQSRPGSITSAVNAKSFFDLAEFVKRYARKEAADAAARCAASFAAYEYSILLWQYSRLPSQHRADALAFLKQFRFVLKHGASRKLRVIRLLTSVLGLKAVSRLLGIYMQHRK